MLGETAPRHRAPCPQGVGLTRSALYLLIIVRIKAGLTNLCHHVVQVGRPSRPYPLQCWAVRVCSLLAQVTFRKRARWLLQAGDPEVLAFGKR